MHPTQFKPLDDRQGYLLALFVTIVATGASAILVRHIAQTNLVMVYLLGVTYVASRCNPKPAVLSCLFAVAAFDFFFVHPSGTFEVEDVQYVFTFIVMLAVGLLISTLTVRLREQSRTSDIATLNAQIEKTRGDLLSSVSHDLRTPLSSIEGSAGALLNQPDLSEQSLQLATTIQEESTRMGQLIRNLLDMTRVQGEISLELDWYAMDELMANAIQRTEALFQNPVQLVVDPIAGLVQVDGVLMEQVFVNLLENAARHAGSSASVTITISGSDTQATVTVADDGPGIAPELQDKIFDRFQGSKRGGVGLGLAICRAAVEAHGGTITATNLPVRGAVFTLSIPREKDSSNG